MRSMKNTLILLIRQSNSLIKFLVRKSNTKTKQQNEISTQDNALDGVTMA